MKFIDFEAAFIKSKGKPVTIEGQEYCLVKRIRISKDSKVQITFLQYKGPYRQGVHLEAYHPFVINGESHTSFILWQDTSPKKVEFDISTDMELTIWNVWDTGNGTVESWHNGAAMIVEEVSDSLFMFKCNDGQPNSDCDDLVFSFSIVRQ